MIKTLISLILICALTADDVYNVSFPDVSGKTIWMKSFRGKKVIVVVINAKSPDIGYLRYLSQLQSKSKAYQIIAIPSIEFSGNLDPAKISELRAKEKLSFLVAQPSELKMSAKSRQHPLMAWITNKDRNEHFGEDIDVTEKIFIINENGVLYAILDKTAGPDVITNTLGEVIK
jgi:glutathione peroxidase-family protein